MCGYCCGGVPKEKRGEGHKNCTDECYNAPRKKWKPPAAPRDQTEDWYCAECGSTKETHIWGEKDGHITHPFQPVLRQVR